MHANTGRILLFVLACWLSPQVLAGLDFQSWHTSNGARVLLIESPGLPMLDIRVVFDGGSARDGGKSGLALLTNSLLDEGAGGLSAQQLAVSFESVGAQVELDSLRDMAYAGLRSLSDAQYLDRALSTFSKVLTRPDFPQDAFDRQLARFKVSVKSRQQSPAEIAEDKFYTELYGDHPYATPVSGTLKSLDAITLDDIKRHYARYYVARNATIAMVGAITRERAADIAEQLSAGLEEGTKADLLSPVPKMSGQVTRFIEYPSTQSHIFIGQPGIRRGQPGFFDLYVANHPFGGSGFSSRLVETIREERGLAYSVYSYFTPMAASGPFIMGMQTKNDQVDEAIELLMTELREYIASGAGEDELSDSISNITGSFPLNVDNNSKMLGNLAMIGFYDLPDDYLDTYLSNVRAVTRDSARQAFADVIDPDRLVTVVVGQRTEKPAADQ